MIYLWKEKIALYRDLLETAEADVAEQLGNLGERGSYTRIETGELLVATVVRAEYTEIDENSLADALGPQFLEVADLKLNRVKLDSAIRHRKVDPELVAKFTLVKEKRPYVRVTKIRDESDDGSA
jgi:hypothetical protein